MGVFLPVGLVVSGAGIVDRRVYYDGFNARIEPIREKGKADDAKVGREGRWMRKICEMLGANYEGTFLFYTDNDGVIRKIVYPDGTSTYPPEGHRELTSANVSWLIDDYKLQRFARALFILIKSGRITYEDLKNVFTLKSKEKEKYVQEARKRSKVKIFHSFEELDSFLAEREKQRVLEIIGEIMGKRKVASTLPKKKWIGESELRREILAAEAM
ncbi:MAG: hypothetical protein QW566_02500 [Candidatus Jordarchaeales archaeon]